MFKSSKSLTAKNKTQSSETKFLPLLKIVSGIAKVRFPKEWKKLTVAVKQDFLTCWIYAFEEEYERLSNVDEDDTSDIELPSTKIGFAPVLIINENDGIGTIKFPKGWTAKYDGLLRADVLRDWIDELSSQYETAVNDDLARLTAISNAANERAKNQQNIQQLN